MHTENTMLYNNSSLLYYIENIVYKDVVLYKHDYNLLHLHHLHNPLSHHIYFAKQYNSNRLNIGKTLQDKNKMLVKLLYSIIQHFLLQYLLTFSDTKSHDVALSSESLCLLHLLFHKEL